VVRQGVDHKEAKVPIGLGVEHRSVQIDVRPAVLDDDPNEARLALYLQDDVAIGLRGAWRIAFETNSVTMSWESSMRGGGSTEVSSS
jgi:hypothetical protein